ncbi:MAG: sodium:alanine symporter family protein, partial [Oscillospiraceae bacterium]|nr:sodium:alanine symporter family protein [Oscillospiraceae bacterium]
MDVILDTLLSIVAKINMYLSDYILIFLLVGVGLYYTIRTRFVQVRCFGEGMKAVFGNFSLKGGKQASGLSSFQALAAAIAAQVGTGNIVGACGAILVGGPGAIFWMWIIAFFGMATIYAEAVLAQKTRTVAEDGTVLGGPVYYIKQAFKGTFGKILAVFFSVAVILALGFMGSMVQSNSISGSIVEVVKNIAPNASILNPLVEGTSISVLTIIIGAIVALAAALVFIGGVQRLGAVTEKLVPIMAGIYLIGGIVVLAINAPKLPETIGMIFKYAFMPNAIIGGSIGAAIYAAISQGAKRGLFSNEAGMGFTPHAHAQANVKDPHE